MRHELKTWPDYFERIESGEKRFEVRKNDRDFQVGDTLALQEFDPGVDGGYSGRMLEMRVTYLLHGGQFGIKRGYCVMGIEPELRP